MAEPGDDARCPSESPGEPITMWFRDDALSVVGAVRSLVRGVWGRAHPHLEILLGDAVVYLTFALLMHRVNQWMRSGAADDIMGMVIYELIRLGELLFIFQFLLMSVIDAYIEIKRKVR